MIKAMGYSVIATFVFAGATGTGNQGSNVSQFRQIAGQVTDAEMGKAIPDVSVSLHGSKLGTKTSPNGRYALEGVPSGSGTLVFAQPCYLRTAVELEGSEDIPRRIDVGLPFNHAESAARGCRRPH